MKLLGIDYGEKKVGLAIGDLDNKIALPFKIVENTNGVFDLLKDICQTEEITKIILGVPVGLKGIKSKQYDKVINFRNKLSQTLDLEVIIQDEKFSSSYAKKLLQETKAKGKDDAVAAMIVLQSYFDGMAD